MKYLTTKEAADILGLNDYRTVIKYIKYGWLKAKRFGKIYMVREKDVLERKERLNS